MKNFIYLSIIGLLFMSCSKGGGDETVVEIKNTAPTVPVLISPTDNKLCVDNTVTFQWNNSTDASTDVITYQIQIAKDNQFSQIIKTAEGTRNSQTSALDKNTAYYWRIKATDNKNLSSDYSVTYKFYTSGDAIINHLPFAPEVVSPILNSSINPGTTTLSWTASDVDTTDKLVYDVYFGTTNPPTQKVFENNNSKTVDVTTSTVQQYYWKIVVKDNKGGETIGQVWKFKTN